MNSYSSEAYRLFKKFVGELTATAAGVQIGTNIAVNSTAQMVDPDPWSALAGNFGIVVNGLKSEQVLQSTARLNIVSLYSGFDLFVANIRSQYFELHQKEWKKYEGDGPFNEIQRNLPVRKSRLDDEPNAARISVVDYYRLVRNAVAHPSVEHIDAVKNYYAKNHENLTRARALYGMKSAPNGYDDLSFHDVKLFAQVTLDLCKVIDLEFDPGDESLARQIPPKIKSRPKLEARIRNAAVGCIRTKFGVSNERAERIFSLYMTHQLDG